MSYPQQPDPTGQQKPPESKRPKRKASAVNVVALIALVAALCVLGVALVTSVGGDDAPADPTSADRSFSAEVMCEEFIDKRLKAPASADYTHQQTAKNGAQYVVTGYVDSQNSFGAQIRTNFVCTVTDQGDDTWRLDDLRLE